MLPIRQWNDKELLEHAELLIDGAVTWAALILLGSGKSLGRYVPQAETIFEYRKNEADIDYVDRVEHRAGFLIWADDLWAEINARNEVQQFQNKLTRHQIPTFEEETLREAVLNAVCHRDYREAGSVWVRAMPRRIEIESPGGFPKGVTSENILDRQNPRNRRLAEALNRCGLVERSGQGADRMFRQSIIDAKPLPDFSRSDEHRVVLRLDGEITDLRFLSYISALGEDKVRELRTADFLALHQIRSSLPISEKSKAQLPRLRELGVVERIARGRFILSKRYQTHLGTPARYTRERGIDRGVERELLLSHLKEFRAGVRISELMEVLPDRSRNHVRAPLSELRQEGKAHVVGERRAGRWLIGPGN